ncbi:MAG: hypothetical protein WCF81_08655 [Roseiarcus sp.]
MDFSNDFATETLKSMTITVHGRPVFTTSPSLNLATWAKQAVIGASNSSGDVLTLTFATPNAGTWAGFNNGSISGGEVIFGGLTGLLLGATGVVTRDSLESPILAPPPIDPPPITDPPGPIAAASVPELSTWAMMLIGLAGLGLAAKGRRALGG